MLCLRAFSVLYSANVWRSEWKVCCANATETSKLCRLHTLNLNFTLHFGTHIFDADFLFSDRCVCIALAIKIAHTKWREALKYSTHNIGLMVSAIEHRTRKCCSTFARKYKCAPSRNEYRMCRVIEPQSVQILACRIGGNVYVDIYAEPTKHIRSCDCLFVHFWLSRSTSAILTIAPLFVIHANH